VLRSLFVGADATTSSALAVIAVAWHGGELVEQVLTYDINVIVGLMLVGANPALSSALVEA
jgi:hypothetical protein